MLKFTKEELLDVLPSDIMKTKELTNKQKTVLGQLIVYNGLEQTKNNGYFYRSNKDLCNDCGISEPTLITTVTKLEMLGYISRKQGKRGVGASEYKISEELLKNNTKNLSNNFSNNFSNQNDINLLIFNELKEINEKITKILSILNLSNNTENLSNNFSTDTESDIDIEKDNIYNNNNILYNNINNIYNKNNINNNNILIDNNSNILEEKEILDIPMEKETNITEAHLESASAEEKAISDDDWYQHLVEPKDDLDELFAEEEMFHVKHSIPVEETQNKAIGDVFSASVDNYQGNEEKSAQNGLKVPQTKSIDTNKVWTYIGREHNGEQMTAQECVDKGLKYWCLQDVETNEFCTSDYLV